MPARSGGRPLKGKDVSLAIAAMAAGSVLHRVEQARLAVVPERGCTDPEQRLNLNGPQQFLAYGAP